MTNFIGDYNPNFISLNVAAENLGIRYNSLIKWLSDNKDIKDQYCQKMIIDGRRKWVLSKDGLLVIANMRETTKSEITSQFRHGKKKMAEAMIVKRDEEQVFIQILQQSQALLQHAQAILQVRTQIETVAEKNNELEERLNEIESGTKKMTTGQRKYLNERVRALALELDAPFPRIWNAVHDMTGRRSIDDYLFEDYGVAIQYLREVFKKKGIEW